MNMRIKKTSLLITLAVLALLPMIAGCGVDRRMHSRLKTADDYNRKSYEMRYVSLDSAEKYAQLALRASRGDADATNEALCNKAFVKHAKSDYDSASIILEEVLRSTHNDLIRLLADVGMMNVCFSISDNKKFYDYRNDAVKRMERIENDNTVLNENQWRIWNYSRSEFNATSDFYTGYMDLPQQHNGLQNISSDLSMIREDTAQIAKYCFMLGIGFGNNLSDDEKIRNLMRCLSISRAKSLLFFRASVAQVMSRMMNDGIDIPQADEVMLTENIDVADSPHDSLPLLLARKSIDMMKGMVQTYTPYRA